MKIKSCHRSAVEVLPLPLGSMICPGGGALIKTKCPSTHAVICNGSIVTATELPVGSPLCPFGGVLIHTTGPPDRSVIVCSGCWMVISMVYYDTSGRTTRLIFHFIPMALSEHE